jgi:uncharacterized protein (DUF4415 family)
MPMLVVDDEDFELELKRLNEKVAQVVPMPKMGRPDGATETPESLRKLIASDSITGNGTAKQIAEAYGVSQSSVNAYAGGATSTDRMVAGKLDNDLVQANQRIGRRAQRKLNLALKHITEDKLRDAKATDISQVAANMSRIIEKTTPKVPETQVQNNIIFYSPQQIGEGNYDVIDVAVEKAS